LTRGFVAAYEQAGQGYGGEGERKRDARYHVEGGRAWSGEAKKLLGHTEQKQGPRCADNEFYFSLNPGVPLRYLGGSIKDKWITGLI
jgi:hypothetical protein